MARTHLRLVRSEEERPHHQDYDISTLFLTRIEEDVWVSLCVLSKRSSVGAFRVSVPSDTLKLRDEWASAALNCSEEEYANAFEKFVHAGVLSYIGSCLKGEKNIFQFALNPACYKVQRIDLIPLAAARKAPSVADSVFRATADIFGVEVADLRNSVEENTDLEAARDTAAYILCHQGGMKKALVARMFRGKKSQDITNMINEIEMFGAQGFFTIPYIIVQANHLLRNPIEVPCNRSVLEAVGCDFVQETERLLATGHAMDSLEIVARTCERFGVAPFSFRAGDDSPRMEIVVRAIVYLLMRGLGYTNKQADCEIKWLSPDCACKVDDALGEMQELLNRRTPILPIRKHTINNP